MQPGFFVFNPTQACLAEEEKQKSPGLAKRDRAFCWNATPTGSATHATHGWQSLKMITLKSS